MAEVKKIPVEDYVVELTLTAGEAETLTALLYNRVDTSHNQELYNIKDALLQTVGRYKIDCRAYDNILIVDGKVCKVKQ